MDRQREILCIDDDPQGLRVRTILLESLGYKVLADSDAERGLRTFRSHPVDAVVMDYQMPGMTGGDAAVQMKQLRPEVPVIILSALPWLPEGAPHEAIDGFIQKGEPLGVIASRIEQLIADHEETAEIREHVTEQIGGTLGHLLGSLASTLRRKIEVH